MATPVFGFSFGDIVAAIRILNDVRKALRDTGGAQDEYRGVQIELQQLEILLGHLNHGTWDTGGDTGQLNAIKGMASTCQVPLQEFLSKVERFKSLQDQDSKLSRRIGIEARKVRWTVGMKEDIEKFRALISAKIAAITLLVQPYTIATMSKIKTQSQAILDTSEASKGRIEQCQVEIEKINSKLQSAATESTALKGRFDLLVQICAGTNVGVEDFRRTSQARYVRTRHHLRRVERQQDQHSVMVATQFRAISSSMATLETLVHHLVLSFGNFTHTALEVLKKSLRTDLEIYSMLREVHCAILRQPAVQIGDSISFTDALGRKRILQYEFFQHWEVFESMLRCDFRRKPGEQRVVQGQYHLLKDSRTTDVIINRSEWGNIIFPGAKIGMSMIVNGLLFQPGLCPRFACGMQNTLLSNAPTLNICSTCDLEYHYAEAIVPKPRIVTTSRLGKDMFRGGNWYEPIRKSPECTDWAEDEGRPSILTSEHLIEDELEAFKVIHIRTMSGLGHPENENTTGRTESYWGFSDLQITPPPIPPVGQHIYPTVPEHLIGSFLDSTLQLTNIIRKDCSVVYSAVNVHTSQVYTVKAYNKYGTDGRPLDERQREALSREFQLHYAVSAHPKIVSLLKIIEDVDCLYAVLEHCPEEDLFSHIVEKEKYVGDDAAIRAAFLQITNAVEHCHRLGIYHRDLRPENVLVRNSTLLLGNFAHATTDEKSVPAMNESTFYMSPECFHDSNISLPIKSSACDIWALGIILINLTCGQNPWRRASPDDPAYAAFKEDCNFLKTIRPISNALNDILIRTFEVDQDRRIVISELRQSISECSSFFEPSFQLQATPKSTFKKSPSPVSIKSRNKSKSQRRARNISGFAAETIATIFGGRRRQKSNRKWGTRSQRERAVEDGLHSCSYSEHRTQSTSSVTSSLDQDSVFDDVRISTSHLTLTESESSRK
ncbi:hypothetical protein B0J14DRAFT_578791 [Halenospora varia]|nr:hypothetical protein B0J14DRAFT_578791 [Halenospora varia]